MTTRSNYAQETSQMSDTQCKSSIRPDYEPFANICYICKKTGKKKSKQFNTLYGLKHHLKTNHDREDEICAGVTRKQILQMIRAISQAIELKMLLDIPKESRHDLRK